MPEVDDEELEDEELDEPQGESRAIQNQRRQIKTLEKEAKAGQDARRKLAFLEAKVPIDQPIGAFFADNYKGELSPEAVKAAWETIAPAVEAPSTTTATQETPEPREEVTTTTVDTGSQARQDLANGAAPADARSGSFRDEVLRESQALLEEGSFADAVTNYVNRMANGVNSGEIEPLANNGYRRPSQ